MKLQQEVENPMIRESRARSSSDIQTVLWLNKLDQAERIKRVQYRRWGGQLSYIEWVEAGEPQVEKK